ncbi:MAG: hypothetical protein DRN26_00215 [Thermoplasmata archaeon]|nr:MAG: hypothetical protein DRN26_00215 [Thermoplasmata archaeon]
MPDITMCPGFNCPRKLECYRHIARPSKYWQSYFANPPPVDADNNCKYFVEATISEIESYRKRTSR